VAFTAASAARRFSSSSPHPFSARRRHPCASVQIIGAETEFGISRKTGYKIYERWPCFSEARLCLIGNAIAGKPLWTAGIVLQVTADLLKLWLRRRSATDAGATA
jgi:hypothetical protein